MDEVTVATREGPEAEVEAPLRFGDRYRPVAFLGSGGMGSVYLARDEELHELVAVKVLRAELLGDPSMVERFRDEVRLARRVSSPLVARTHDLAQHEGRWFVTMQYVEGETLSAKLKRDGRLGMADAVPIARDACDGLSAVHTAGIVHRDLKPGNVILGADGRAVLTDFGIALRADSATLGTDGFGTPTYVAPEQLGRRAVDARTDVFSLGAMLFTMVTARLPFPAQRVGTEGPPDPRHTAPEVTDALAALIMRAMALDPGDRFSSAAALRAALDALALPASVGPRSSALPAFVRSLGAGAARKLFVPTMELVGVGPMLGNAARADLLSRLQARGQVQVVPTRGGAEAALASRLEDRGGVLTLSMALESEPDRYEFWADTTEARLSALPQMIERAAHAVERAFLPLSRATQSLESFPSAEVASLFLEARTEYRGYWGANIQRSVDLFERALAQAPDHPLIIAWHATALCRHAFFQGDPEERRRGHELALTATALAPGLAEAQIALALAYLQEQRAVEAIPHFIAALGVSPGLVDQRASLARILHECGAVAPALALVESTLEYDPAFHEPLDVLVRHHGLRGRMDLAAAQLVRAPPSRGFLMAAFARGCVWSRDSDAYDRQCARPQGEGLDTQPARIIEFYRKVLAGEPLTFGDIEGPKGGTARRRTFGQQLRAEVYSFNGDTSSALAALERAIECGLFDIQWLDQCPLFDPMRGSLRFETVRRTAHARAIDILAEIERCCSPDGA